MTLTITSTIELNNGVQMPRLGLGTYRMPFGMATQEAIRYALDIGYRLIDTASVYGNEEDVGTMLTCSTPSRSEMFVATKVWNDDQGYDATITACYQSLSELRTHYVDLYLIHWPVAGKWQETWRAMETLYEKGACRAIGVSNFAIHHLEELMTFATLTPAINQIEFNPFHYPRDLVSFCQEHTIGVESYSPLARGQKFAHPVLQEIAGQHGKTAAQVMLRWALQHDAIIIPKANAAEHISENADIFDFALPADVMAALDDLNEDFSTIAPEWKAQFA